MTTTGQLGTLSLGMSETEVDAASIPAPAVKVDWDNNGNYSGTYDYITSEVLSIAWHRGAPDWAGGSETGGATIRVRNYDQKYNPDNAAGPLYGNLLPGRPVHIMATYNGTTYGIFGGYIERIIPLADGGVREAELICVDVFQLWSRRMVYLDAATETINGIGAIRADVLTKLGAAYPVLPAEEGMWAVPAIGQDYHGAVTVLEDLNRVVGSRHAIRPKATPTGSVGWEYFCVSRTNKLSSAVDETITNVHAVNGYEVTGENVINSPVVSYSETLRMPGPPLTLWTAPSLPFVIPVGTTYMTSPTFDTPKFSLAAHATTTGGTATVTTGDCGTMARVRIAATVSNVTVTALTVTGYDSLVATPVTVNSSDAASIAAYGEQSGRGIDSSFLATETLAKALADYLLWRYKDPRKRPTITLAAVFSTILTRELFDVIALTISTLSVNARRFEIVGITGSCNQSHAWEAQITVQEMTEQAGSLSSWFIIGTSVIGGADILAH